MDTTQSVRELYEDYPYPGHGIVSGVVAGLARTVVQRLQRDLGRRDLRVLDAGCGTGEQTLGLVKAFPDLRVTGIDLSAASLDFARSLAARHCLGATFERRNLMQPLDGLGPFDLVVSIGTLHHLPDPATGLSHLRGVVAERGALLAMLYGRFGWQEMSWTRDALEILSGEAGSDRAVRLSAWEGMRLGLGKRLAGQIETALRRRRFGPAIGLLEAARRAAAGRSRAYYADALTHVQEATFTWNDVITLLERTGWSFAGWPPRSGMPDAPEAIFGGRALELSRRRTMRELAAVYERILRPPCLYFVAEPAVRTSGPARETNT